MKHLTRIIFILIVVSFLLAPFGVVDAADKEVKKEKTAACDTHKYCCPMCKKEMNKDEAKFKVEYKEKTYYFCCEKCKAEFEKDPEKFIKACEEAKKCCEGKTAYVCPMKQCNVKSDKPGKCPKCGMELKKVVEHAECCKLHEHKKEHKHEHKHESEHKH